MASAIPATLLSPRADFVGGADDAVDNGGVFVEASAILVIVVVLVSLSGSAEDAAVVVMKSWVVGIDIFSDATVVVGVEATASAVVAAVLLSGGWKISSRKKKERLIMRSEMGT
jgi:hypothetical protein